MKTNLHLLILSILLFSCSPLFSQRGLPVGVKKIERAGVYWDGGSTKIEFLDKEDIHWALFCDRSIEAQTKRKENFDKLSVSQRPKDEDSPAEWRELSEEEGQAILDGLKKQFDEMPESEDIEYLIIRDFLISRESKPNQSR